MASRGVTLNRAAVSRSLGNVSNARRKVDTTLVVMVDSLSSVTLYVEVAIPAFSTNASSLWSPFNRAAKASTDSYDERSSSQTSTTPFLPVLSSIDFLASSPLDCVRTARITFSALRRVKWRAASSPSPAFEPVTTIVWLIRSCVG